MNGRKKKEFMDVFMYTDKKNSFLVSSEEEKNSRVYNA